VLAAVVWIGAIAGGNMSSNARWNIAASIGIAALLTFVSGWRSPSQMTVPATDQEFFN